MIRKKVVSVICSAALVAGMLAGCSSDTASSGATASAGGTASSGGAGSGSGVAENVTLNVVTAGDTNMVTLQNQDIAPLVQKEHPGWKLNVVGTGPGDAGSQNIYNKLKAQKDAGKSDWDIDVAIVHQSVMGKLLQDGLVDKYVSSTDVGPNLASDAAKNSLGTDVTGYVIPLFSSQACIAYNSKTVQNPPKTIDDTIKWIKANPQKFGYNGVKNGMSGVAFVAAYLYAEDSANAEKLMKGPYDKSTESKWNTLLSALKSLPTTATNGNDGTLDMLNRGEIDMGPVWVDMFYTDQSQGRMSSDVKLVLPSPGMPGQPMYIVVPSKAAHKNEAVKFAELLGSPQTQAQIIVDKFNWYPGIDPTKVLSLSSQKAKDSLFKDISADDLNKYGKTFLMTQYQSDMLDAYENAK